MIDGVHWQTDDALTDDISRRWLLGNGSSVGKVPVGTDRDPGTKDARRSKGKADIKETAADDGIL